MTKRTKRGKAGIMALGPTEIGGKFTDEDFTGLQSIGHGLIWVEHGTTTGRIDYPGPGSGVLSQTQGNYQPIVDAVGPWILGGQVIIPDDETAHQPRVVLNPETSEYVVQAGWAAPGLSWKKSLGPGQGSTPMHTDVWAYVNQDGSIQYNADTVPAAVGALKALDQAAILVTAARAIIAGK